MIILHRVYVGLVELLHDGGRESPDTVWAAKRRLKVVRVVYSFASGDRRESIGCVGSSASFSAFGICVSSCREVAMPSSNRAVRRGSVELLARTASGREFFEAMLGRYAFPAEVAEEVPKRPSGADGRLRIADETPS